LFENRSEKTEIFKSGHYTAVLRIDYNSKARQLSDYFLPMHALVVTVG